MEDKTVRTMKNKMKPAMEFVAKSIISTIALSVAIIIVYVGMMVLLAPGTSEVYGQGKKVTSYPEDTSPTSDDILYIVDDPAGTPASRKVTIGNLTKGLVAASTSTSGVVTTGSQTFAGDKVFDVDSTDVTPTQGLSVFHDFTGGAPLASNKYGIYGLCNINTQLTGSSAVWGALIQSRLSAAGTAATLYGFSTSFDNQSTAATLTTAYGQRIQMLTRASTTTTTAYGQHVSYSTQLGTITNTYGVYVADITGGTQTNQAYSFYASDANARNFFDGTETTFNNEIIVNESGTDSDTRIEGDNDENLFYVDASTNRVGIGAATPSAKLDVKASTGNDPVLTISSAPLLTTGSPTTTTYQSDITTTNATPQMILAVAVPIDTVCKIHAEVIARKNDGSEGAAYVREWAYRNSSDTVTQIGTDGEIFTAEDDAGWDVTEGVSGTDVQIFVTGTPNPGTLFWHLSKCEVSFVGN